MNLKKNLLIYSLVVFAFQLSKAQMNLLTEDFETDGEGSRYTSNHFDNACHDFFERYFNGGGNCLTNEPTNVNGTFYWAGEDVDVATGGTGIVTLNPLTVTGYNLELQAMAAIGRPNDFRLETDDELLFQYNMDGAGWITFGAFYGNNGTGMGNLQLDADLNGVPDVGGPEVSSSDFTDWTFAIPVTGNSLQVRFIMGQNTGTEEIMVDYIRINTTPILPIDLTEFSVQKMEKDKVKINWQTASEINNEYFSIQRSNDGNSWEEINRINGAGNSNATINYSSVDEKPYFGNSYYRLKQVDFNGDYKFSNIESVNLDSPNSRYAIYPNPTSYNQIGIEIPYDRTEVLIFDGSGQLIYQSIKDKGLSKISLQKFYAGIYFVKFIHADKMDVQKLILEDN